MRWIFFFITISLSISLLAQYKPYLRFTEADGLADNAVQDLVIDKEGYLWIATNNGVSKYDGEKFVNFQKRNGLLGNYAWALAVDDDNNMWVGCYKEGLNLIRNDSVVASYTMEMEKYNNSIRKLHYSTKHQTLFVGTDDGLFFFKDSVFRRIDSPRTGNRKCSVLAIEEEHARLFFSVHNSGGGMYEVVKDSCKEFLYHTIQQLKYSKIGIEIIGDSIFCNEHTNIYKWRINDVHSDTSVINPSSTFLTWDMAKDDNNLLLAGWGEHDLYSGGIKKYNLNTGRLQELPYEIKGHSFMSILHDKVTNITWAGGDGLYAFPRSTFNYQEISQQSNVTDVSEIDATKYLISDNYIYKEYNSGFKEEHSIAKIEKIILEKINQIRKTKNLEEYFRIINPSYKLKFLKFIATNDKHYLMTNKGSLSFPDFKEYFPFESGKFSILKDKAYAIGDYKSIRCFLNFQDSICFADLEGVAAKIGDVVKIVEKGDTLLFPSHFHGMFALVNNQGFELNSTNGFDDIITDMDISPDGEIWSTSVDGNLFNVGFEDSLFVKSRFNNQNGLMGTKFNWLKFHKDYLYLGTNKGLNIVPVRQLSNNGERLMPFFYNKHNGYSYILSKKPQVDSKGNLYVFDDERLIYIDDPKNISIEPLIIRTDILVNGDGVASLNGASLSHSRNNIRVSFKCIKFPSTRNLKYQYRINGNEWHRGNEIRLESLKSGKYAIDIKVNNMEDGSITQESIQFKIRKAFWQRWWFYVLVILTVGFALYYFINKRINCIKRDAEERQNLNHQLNEIRIRSLQGQLNPHFIFNALNSVQYFILMENVEEALTYLGNLSGVIRQNLSNLGEEFIKLDDEVKFIGQYLELEKLRFKDRLTYQIRNNFQSEGIKIPPMLIQPFVENAIKHGLLQKDGVGKVQIEIDEKDANMLIIITDNGIGREKARENNTGHNEGNGKATNITQKRLELLNQKFKTNNFCMEITDLKDASNNPTGTKVIITLDKVLN
ncbi:sensor histidine kinase [Saccharicrinis sp. 156]|uniref:sensor histidine kinase n=1 Tax=Saccharicrinis sp. 156 TaxID=3417574 RepID=UPI003D34D25D